MCLSGVCHAVSNLCSITLRVAALPSTFFDGTDTVTFQAVDVMASPSNTSGSTSPTSDDNHDDGGGNGNLTAARESSSTASFDVTFFHCASGSFWVRELAGGNGSDEHTGTCEPCNENEADGETQVCAGISHWGAAARFYEFGCCRCFWSTATVKGVNHTR